MKSAMLLLLVAAVGGALGWHAHALGNQTNQTVRASTPFSFNDNDWPYLFVMGSWRGADIANKINTVEIWCDAPKKTCKLAQADVMPPLYGAPSLSLYTKSFRITKVDAQSMMAEPETPDNCVRQTLMFDRLAKAVTLVRTKINHECSIVQNEPLTLFLGEPL